MGNSKSKKAQKEPDKFFERVRWQELKREELKKKNVNNQKRGHVKEPPVTPAAMLAHNTLGPTPVPAPAHTRSYDEVALERMRDQLTNNSDLFLLNNILLSVQFFENYEREVHQIKNKPISEHQHKMDEAMVQHHKHVFFADRIQECVQDHVTYQTRTDHSEPLIAPRLFIIYDNVEASEPGDTSDYCAVLDAPFYKLRIEDSKETGYVKLKKLEILGSTLAKETQIKVTPPFNCDDSDIYTDSEKESHASDDPQYSDKEEMLQKITLPKLRERNSRLLELESFDDVSFHDINKKNIANDLPDIEISSHVSQKQEGALDLDNKENEIKPRKSILKQPRRHSEIMNKPKLDSSNSVLQTSHISLDNITAEDTETSGYRSNASSRQAEASETESDYGYATITDSTTPKRIELSLQTNYATTSGVLPDESWITVNVRSMDWSDEEDDDGVSKVSLNRELYESHHYLSSITFMNDFVDNFILHLGNGLGFPQDSVKNSLTQGASIYCNASKNGSNVSYEVFPALIAAWPNAANQWVIRERKIIQNPRTNFSYQWPTKYMVSKAFGFGCLLVPIGFRPKRGINPDQKLQWKIMFPAAERYLESCLAHSHMRCYLFALALHKTFLEHQTSKIGLDGSHIKNHLFWQCEDNYASWPEDRLGESLLLFLKSFYRRFGKSRFPNYFIESCNEFKCIPKPLLLKLQRQIADILEAPVMHLLHAVNKIKYTKKDFYPKFNCQKLYDILTCKNPWRMLNPQIPVVVPTYNESSDSDDDRMNNIHDKGKVYDKEYQWKIEKLKQITDRRVNIANKKQKKIVKGEREINKSIILPAKMEVERRRLVLEFFIPHFIAMARSSEKFDALRQAVIYLEQAKRLCILLREEPAGDSTANEYLEIIRDKLSDCQRKIVHQEGYKQLRREKTRTERNVSSNLIRKHRPKCEHIINQHSPSEGGMTPFTFADVHFENNFNQEMKKYIELNGTEESKL